MDGLRSIGRRGSAQVKAGLEKQASSASLGGLPPPAEVDPDHEEASPTLEFHGTADIHVTVLTVDIGPAAQFSKNRRELELEIMFKVRRSAEEPVTRDGLPALTGIRIARALPCARVQSSIVLRQVQTVDSLTSSMWSESVDLCVPRAPAQLDRRWVRRLTAGRSLSTRSCVGRSGAVAEDRIVVTVSGGESRLRGSMSVKQLLLYHVNGELTSPKWVVLSPISQPGVHAGAVQMRFAVTTAAEVKVGAPAAKQQQAHGDHDAHSIGMLSNGLRLMTTDQQERAVFHSDLPDALDLDAILAGHTPPPAAAPAPSASAPPAMQTLTLQAPTPAGASTDTSSLSSGGSGSSAAASDKAKGAPKTKKKKVPAKAKDVGVTSPPLPVSPPAVPGASPADNTLAAKPADGAAAAPRAVKVPKVQVQKADSAPDSPADSSSSAAKHSAKGDKPRRTSLQVQNSDPSMAPAGTEPAAKPAKKKAADPAPGGEGAPRSPKAASGSPASGSACGSPKPSSPKPSSSKPTSSKPPAAPESKPPTSPKASDA